MPAKAARAEKTRPFEGALLRDVLDLGAGPDPMTRCRREQVLDESTLSLGARTLATGVGTSSTPISHTPAAGRSFWRQSTRPSTASSSTAAITRQYGLEPNRRSSRQRRRHTSSD